MKAIVPIALGPVVQKLYVPLLSEQVPVMPEITTFDWTPLIGQLVAQ